MTIIRVLGRGYDNGIRITTPEELAGAKEVRIAQIKKEAMERIYVAVPVWKKESAEDDDIANGNSNGSRAARRVLADIRIAIRDASDIAEINVGALTDISEVEQFTW